MSAAGIGWDVGTSTLRVERAGHVIAWELYSWPAPDGDEWVGRIETLDNGEEYSLTVRPRRGEVPCDGDSDRLLAMVRP